MKENNKPWKCQKCGIKTTNDVCENCGDSILIQKKRIRDFKVLFVIALVFIVIAFVVVVLMQSNFNAENTNSSYSSVVSIASSVNYENFEKIQTGMTYEQVVEIFGKEGKIMSTVDIGIEEYATTVYYWYDHTGVANCNVTVQGGKVVAKAQVGLK